MGSARIFQRRRGRLILTEGGLNRVATEKIKPVSIMLWKISHPELYPNINWLGSKPRASMEYAVVRKTATGPTIKIQHQRHKTKSHCAT